MYSHFTLFRSGVWIDMKVLGADSFILDTRKLWRMFPIKQIFHRTAAFLDNYWIYSSLDVFYHCVTGLVWKNVAECNGLSKKLSGFKYFYYKKAAMILDFCLFGNIRHNFLVPRIIESAPKTFMPIQIPDVHRVIWHWVLVEIIPGICVERTQVMIHLNIIQK